MRKGLSKSVSESHAKKINSDNSVNSDKTKMQMDNMDKKDNMDREIFVKVIGYGL